MSLATSFYLEVCFVSFKYGHTCFSLNAIYLEYHLPHLHFEPIFVFVAEVDLLEATCINMYLGFILNSILLLCALVGEFSPFMFRVMAHMSLYLLFSGGCVSPLLLSYCVVCCFSLVVFYEFFLFPLLLLLHVLSVDFCFVVTIRFVYQKFETYNSPFYSDCILFSFTCASSVLSPPFLLSQMITFYAVCSFPNCRGYSLFLMLSPL